MKRIFLALTGCALILTVASCGSRQNGKGAEGSDLSSIGPSAEEMAKLQNQFNNMSRSQEIADSIAQAQKDLGIEPVYIISTNYGNIKVKLYNDTPLHRDNFCKLANSGFYNGTLMHRVVKGFVIQGGDPYTKDTTMVAKWGEGGPGYTIPAEFIAEHTHKKGALAAARRGDIANPMKESSGSQFYIVADGDACLHLNGDYTVFGETIDGLKTVELISAVKTDKYSRPLQDVKIISIRLEGSPETAVAEPEKPMSEAEKLEEVKKKYGNLKDISEVRREREEAAAKKNELSGKAEEKEDGNVGSEVAEEEDALSDESVE